MVWREFPAMEAACEVAVVGAGIAGLACARELQRAGLSVRVFEREKTVGGRMASRTRDGLTFDCGANFLVRAYATVFAMAEEQGVPLRTVSPVEHAVYRDGRFHDLHLSSVRGQFRLDCLGLWSRFKALRFLVRLRRDLPLLDFFHLSDCHPRFNHRSADELARSRVGRSFADYLVDPFNACMMFYRASEISEAALLSLLRMMVDPGYDFGIYFARGEMQGLASALAQPLPVTTNTAVLRLRAAEGGWEVQTSNESLWVRRVVLATTAPAALHLLPPQAPQRKLLEKVRYSSTVNVSFRLPPEVLGRTHCWYVPAVEGSMICEFTNESLKGYPLVSVGLHEVAARSLLGESDRTVFQVVGRELLDLLPDLKADQLGFHDLQRWPEAIPKYDCDHIARVAEFERGWQGHGGLFFCGDYLNAPWLEGAARSGQRAARLLLQRR